MSIIISILFFIAPFISIPFIFFGILFDKKHNFIYSLLLALVFALVAYNFIPNQNHDLYRYYYEMEYFYSNISWERYLFYAFSNTKIIFVFFQYIFSQIGNYRLLPFFITFIGYLISFYIILDYSKLKKYRGITKILIILFFACIFYHINFISGLAQYLSISIGFLGFYLEFIKGKNKIIYKILYIIPIFIHISMFIIPLIRIVLHFDFRKIKSKYITTLIIYMFFPILIYKITSLFPALDMISSKIYSYMVMGNRSLFTVYDIFTFLLILFFLIIFYDNKDKIKKEVSNKFLEFTELILLFNVFSPLYRDIFSRILNISILCMCLYIMSLISITNSKKLPIILIFILLFSVILGSVSFNIFRNNDFNNIFSNLFNNFNYYISN